VRVSVVVGALPNAVAFIDTNMRRVLHRVFIGPDVPEPAAIEPALLAFAEKLVPPGATPPRLGTRR
jgi:A/G-specific adenine glycosylase